MAQRKIYEASPSRPTFLTSNVGPSTSPEDFGAAIGRSQQQVAGALGQAGQVLSHVANQQAEIQKQDEDMWVQAVYSQKRREWLEKDASGQLTDPEAVRTEFNAQRDELAMQAPSPRAKFHLEQHLNNVEENITLKLMRNQAAGREDYRNNLVQTSIANDVQAAQVGNIPLADIPAMSEQTIAGLSGGKVGPKGQPAPGALPDSLLSFVKNKEGFAGQSYTDHGQESVGYGTRAKFKGEKLTPQEADARLQAELTDHKNRIEAAAKAKGFDLNENQKNALISYDFNTGKGIKAIESAKSVNDIASKLTINTIEGKPSAGLSNRRREEVAMFNGTNQSRIENKYEALGDTFKKQVLSARVTTNPQEVLANVDTDLRIIGLSPQESLPFIEQAHLEVGTRAMAGQTPQAMFGVLEKYRPNESNPIPITSQNKVFWSLQEKQKQSMVQLNKDPAAHFSSNPQISAIDKRIDFLSSQKGNQAAQIASRALIDQRGSKMIELQRLSNIAETRIVSDYAGDQTAAQIINKLNTNPDDAVKVIDEMRAHYGGYFGKAFSEVATKRKADGTSYEIPMGAMFLSAVSKDASDSARLPVPGWADSFKQSLRSDAKINKVSQIESKDVLDGLGQSAYKKLQQTFENLRPIDRRTNETVDSIKSYAEFLFDRGEVTSKKEAVKIAADRLVGETQGFIDYKGKTLSVSRGDAKDKGVIEQGLKEVVPLKVSEAMIPAALAAEIGNEKNAALNTLQKEAFPVSIPGTNEFALAYKGAVNIHYLLDKNGRSIRLSMQEVKSAGLDSVNRRNEINSIPDYMPIGG